ncbi:hypothetical protein [Moheibacter sediminis]|uniref:Tetratricopeptide repeat-containing protein n=1 Tax=Moheibacter sediminis TaxID=1434700 RepID=A0A1W1ZTR0_9FLAO|nr:hypothetical protein [Moheibacter sediminis]SMC51458.1 hypothetical protein SAMN06296427_103209 [Moheibacter sediminis]
MNTRIQHLINKPFEVQLSDVALLQDEIDKYPYFATLRSLLLFGLKEFEHESYNTELKKTSIYSPSRVALYHYLQREKQTTEVFEEVEPISEAETIETPAETAQISEEIIKTKEELVQAEETETIEVQPEIETIPVSTHQEMTFSQWLHISETKTEEKPTEKDIKFQLIDEFIEKSPKISPVKISTEISQLVVKNDNPSEYSDLMTETLAQIYTQQKKFDKAIRAYKILSLKYPEKSIFFADRINEIENLKNTK